jgi:hypothetical protein
MANRKKVRDESKTKKWVVVGALIVGAVSIAYFAKGAFWGGSEVDEMVLALREAPADQRFAEFEKIRTRAEQMTEEERLALWERMRQVHEEEMNRRVNEYLDAPEDQKEAILDRHLDEIAARHERWRGERERRGEGENGEGGGRRGDGGDAGGPPPPDGAGPPPDGQNGQGGGGTGQGSGSGGAGGNGVAQGGGPQGDGPRPGGRGGWHGPSKQARKAHMEGTNPDSMVRHRQYMEKLRARAKTRGMEFGPGPGGRGGGHGGPA